MTIDQTNVIDIVAVADGEVKLVLTDHLPWAATYGDPELLIPEFEHLYMLQSKINRYLDCIENGGAEIYEMFPHARGLPLVVEVYEKYARATSRSASSSTSAGMSATPARPCG
jgi:hypothetical protein